MPTVKTTTKTITRKKRQEVGGDTFRKNTRPRKLRSDEVKPSTRKLCVDKTKAGKPCKGTPVLGTGKCMAHSPEEIKQKLGFGGNQPGAGRPKRSTPSEIQKQLMERYELAVQRPYWRTLGYDVKIADNGDPELVEIPNGGAKVFGQSKDGDTIVSNYDDLGAMIAAAEKLMDRVYGRPKQSSEVTVITQDAMESAIEKMEKELADNDHVHTEV